MPYIPQSDRPPIDAALQAVAPAREWSAGQVAYAVYRIVNDYCKPQLSFATAALVVGAVVLTMARFVLKVVMPYEDQKEAENGGVD